MNTVVRLSPDSRKKLDFAMKHFRFGTLMNTMDVALDDLIRRDEAAQKAAIREGVIPKPAPPN